MRVVVTGPVGVDKKPFLVELEKLAKERGKSLKTFHVGDMMYADAPDVAPGRILDIPLARLNALRRSVFKEILAEASNHETVVVNTHASFRWRHGLFPAFDHDQMKLLDADIYIALVDNVDAVHERLDRDHEIHHTLKDVLVWREEEILATEVLASAIRGHGHFYIFARGCKRSTVPSLYSLIFEPGTKKVYPSFPMTHVMDMPETLKAIDAFRDEIAEHFITFDPAEVDEKRMLIDASAALRQGEQFVTFLVNGREMKYSVDEITHVAKDIDGQIYARDFKLIDQSDMIVSFVPALADGSPGLSSGVERELQHAHEVTKEVYVIWEPEAEPSPFVTTTATKVFRTMEEALAHFRQLGYIKTGSGASSSNSEVARST
ncbi:MAG: AAA family ATPase [Planctomycetota bacterium]